MRFVRGVFAVRRRFSLLKAQSGRLPLERQKVLVVVLVVDKVASDKIGAFYRVPAVLALDAVDSLFQALALNLFFVEHRQLHRAV